MRAGYRDNKFPSYRLHGLIVGTVVAVAAIVIANVAVIIRMHQSSLNDVHDTLLRQSLALSATVERTFQSADLVLASVAERVRLIAAVDSDLKELKGGDFHVFLREKLSGLPQIDTIGLLDAEGQRLNLSHDWPSANVDLSYRSYFQAIKNDPSITSFVSEPLQGNDGGAWVVILARPVTTNDGRLVGVVFASTRLDYFEDLLHTMSLGDGYAATLFRLDGTLLARYPAVDEIGKHIQAPILTSLNASRSGLSEEVSPIDHQSRLAAAYRLLNYPLAVATSEQEDAAFAIWRKAAVSMGVVALIMIIVIMVAATFIARTWQQQARLTAARANVIESEKVRALAEAELNRQRDLAEQNMRFNAAVQNMSQGLCMFDKDQRLVVCNELYAAMYKLPKTLIRPGTAYGDIIAHRFQNRTAVGGDGEMQRELISLTQVTSEGKSSRLEEHDDGRLIRVTHRSMERGGWVATHDDITDQRRAEQQLDETRRFLHSIISNIPVAVVVKDATTRKYILVNRAFAIMLGLPEHQMLGHSAGDFYENDTTKIIDDGDSAALLNRHSTHYSEYEVKAPKGDTRIHATSRIVVRTDLGKPKYLVAVIEDITERKRAEERTTYLAHHDPLTGLANRAAIMQRIEEAVAQCHRTGEPFTIFLMDLDRFKHVNDTLGHSVGDALLQEVSSRF